MGKRARAWRAQHQIARTSIRRGRRRAGRQAGAHALEYAPLVVDPRSARQGVSARLWGALLSLSLTALCAVALLTIVEAHLVMLAVMITAAGSLSLAVAMLLSARREEQVHQLAHQLLQDSQALSPALLEGEDAMTDGSVR